MLEFLKKDSKKLGNCQRLIMSLTRRYLVFIETHPKMPLFIIRFFIILQKPTSVFLNEGYLKQVDIIIYRNPQLLIRYFFTINRQIGLDLWF